MAPPARSTTSSIWTAWRGLMRTRRLKNCSPCKPAAAPPPQQSSRLANARSLAPPSGWSPPTPYSICA
ncbi:hypothetical protein G6F65_014241 [Rhizopus arrhizus]|nr:hypothetical protein G6F65_014241 [Rhizopus arrhizus]